MAVASAFDNAVQIIRANIGSPVITLEGDNPVTISVGTAYTDAGATCTDTVDGTMISIEPVADNTVNVNQVGEYTVTYSCVDTAGNQAPEVVRTVTVQVESNTNTPPRVSAGPDQTITKGESLVTLRGATVTDTEDDATATALGILWTQDPLGTVTIDSPNILESTIAVPISATERTVTLTLTVTDSEDATASDTKVLTLNTPPRVEAGDNLGVTKGASITLTGATADDDDTGDTLTYA